ncbi:uncharacterized mitochondrial protein AtMg00820-like [Hibiscus syriacus]|uniref:uncharacterized mitochondrial protein AtMg00820-like n=1 Tax=Hibiscus syriacus TaxID=106335 RepID=UPI0019221BA2|nr:uncharacterized mitochondrial protein AtMg00820-like [Hibiscus syriacus]
MITQGKSIIFKPKVLIAELDNREPVDVYEALRHPAWRDVVQQEYSTLMQNQTWELQPLPPARAAVGCKWLFKVNNKADGTVDRYKARLVAKGYSQTVGRDFSETFNPVVRANTIRIILATTVMKKWVIRQT